MRPAETEAASPSSSADTMYHDHEPHSQPQACQSNHAHLEEVDQQPSHPEFDFPASPGHVVFDDAVEDLLQVFRDPHSDTTCVIAAIWPSEA